ncbi:MAG: CPBP family intramembrane glutamic endopeptidase [bacterium]
MPTPTVSTAPSPQPVDRSVLAELAGVFVGALVLVRLNDWIGAAHPTIRGLVPPIVWIYGPLLVLTARHRSPWGYGLDLGDWRGGLRDGLVTLAVMLPLYVFGHYLFATLWQGHAFRFRWPPDLSAEIAGNLLAVGFPEEVFFRGYVLGRLEDACGRDRALWGGRLGWAVVGSAIAFNAAHPLAGGHWWQGNVPFGLLLGWLRTRRESLVAPTLVHGLTNVVFRWAELCFGG